jgi:hypothetical protein
LTQQSNKKMLSLPRIRRLSRRQGR